ncbi:LysM peptidoglycan-binding domain-containing M23 family metallopeptidase [Streptomyces sp. NPDC087658]|uniref:LysM peptidoglycan-binding domain-containing M23 family metallopeptidase n=1 Tax=Streptomyces sp. NPDC087658 TaxID=3365800 RepID=UPI0038049CB5
MPAKGKHRRPKSSPFSRRGFIAAGTGGAAIALPLIGAAGAEAAPSVAPQATSELPQAVPAAAQAASAARTARSEAAVQSATAVPQQRAAAQIAAARATKTYSVVSGDYLSRIADEQNVQGGWQKLYEDNREAVGGDPGMIHPGLKLALGSKATTARAETRAESSGPPSSSRSSASSASSSSGSAKPSTVAKAPEAEAPTTDKAAQSSGSGFTRPVDSAVGTSYRASGGSWSSGYHTGVDFIAPSGSTIKAVGAGTVVTAGWGGSYGNQIVIRHDDGRYSQYAHLSSLSVSTGQSVGQGQQIGLSGATGNVTGPHLHFEIRTGPEYGSDIDPLAYLRAYGVTV